MKVTIMMRLALVAAAIAMFIPAGHTSPSLHERRRDAVDIASKVQNMVDKIKNILSSDKNIDPVDVASKIKTVHKKLKTVFNSGGKRDTFHTVSKRGAGVEKMIAEISEIVRKLFPCDNNNIGMRNITYDNNKRTTERRPSIDKVNVKSVVNKIASILLGSTKDKDLDEVKNKTEARLNNLKLKIGEMIDRVSMCVLFDGNHPFNFSKSVGVQEESKPILRAINNYVESNKLHPEMAEGLVLELSHTRSEIAQSLESVSERIVQSTGFIDHGKRGVHNIEKKRKAVLEEIRIYSGAKEVEQMVDLIVSDFENTYKKIQQDIQTFGEMIIQGLEQMGDFQKSEAKKRIILDELNTFFRAEETNRFINGHVRRYKQIKVEIGKDIDSVMKDTINDFHRIE